MGAIYYSVLDSLEDLRCVGYLTTAIYLGIEDPIVHELSPGRNARELTVLPSHHSRDVIPCGYGCNVRPMSGSGCTRYGRLFPWNWGVGGSEVDPGRDHFGAGE